MNEENEEVNCEEQLDDLPIYIQNIINDCTLDKKETSHQQNQQTAPQPEEKKPESENNLSKSPKFAEIFEEEGQLNDNTPIKSANPQIGNNNNNTANTTPNKTPITKDKNENTPSTNAKTENQGSSIRPFSIKEESENNNNEKENIQDNFSEFNLDNMNYDFNINPFQDSSENNGIKVYCIQESELLNIKRSYRLQSILQNNYIGYRNNTCECTICFKRIQNYGLLSNCDDVFCYDCIKQWRTEAISKNKREMFRRCPICNCESPMLIKSKTYATGDEKKKKFNELKQEKKINQNNNFINKFELK